MVAHESSHPARLPRSFPSQAPSLETAEQRGVLTLTVERKEKKRDTCGLKSGSVGKERRQTDGFSLNMSEGSRMDPDNSKVTRGPECQALG